MQHILRIASIIIVSVSILPCPVLAGGCCSKQDTKGDSSENTGQLSDTALDVAEPATIIPSPSDTGSYSTPSPLTALDIAEPPTIDIPNRDDFLRDNPACIPSSDDSSSIEGESNT